MLGQIERGALKYTLPCIKYIAEWEPAVLQRDLNLVLCDDPEVWDWEEGGERKAQEEGIYVHM